MHASSTRSMHQTMRGGKKHEISQKARDWIDRQVRGELAHMAGTNAIELDVATRYVVGAFLEVMH